MITAKHFIGVLAVVLLFAASGRRSELRRHGGLGRLGGPVGALESVQLGPQRASPGSGSGARRPSAGTTINQKRTENLYRDRSVL